MASAEWAARLILAAVFAIAGVAKALDPAGSVEAIRGFGVPARPAAAFGRALPWLELTIAGLLLAPATASSAAIAALALLAAFAAAIAIALARGARPACRCFGQLSAAPVGPRTLVRNLALAALAAFG